MDEYVWTEIVTTNISDPNRFLFFKYVNCMEYLRYNNIDCWGVIELKGYNELY